ncbi:MAG: DUF3429 domain-containing protein [Alphaproteobacteria bacterium]
MARPTLDDVPRPALVLGGLGLIPFIAGAAGAWALDPDLAGLAIPLQFFWACAALSFLGAVHWGLAIAAPRGATWRRLGWSVMPALLAWLLTALELEPVQMGLALVLAYPVTLAVDVAATRKGWAPAWYPALRIPLTIVATLALAASVWRLA